MLERILILALFLLAFYGLMGLRNLIKKVYALAIMNQAVVLLFIVEGGTIGEHAPLVESEPRLFVDPVPQALMLTAIVVGVCVSALALALAFRLHRIHGTLDSDLLREKTDRAPL